MAKGKLLQVIGSRPNCVKFFNVTGKDIVVWTGQHYSRELRENMLKEFNIKLNYELGVQKLGEMIDRLKCVYDREKPMIVLVYGDTRSALAGALAAHEMDIAVAHVEAGIRGNSNYRPEERIRKMIDHMSVYLFAPTETAVANLKRENITDGIALVGDLHYDRYLQNRKSDDYFLLTIHRAEHTEDKNELEEIIEEAGDGRIIFPIHPRTRKAIEKHKIKIPKNVEIINPVGYKKMLELIKNAALVITDSGGVSREAWLVVLR